MARTYLIAGATAAAFAFVAGALAQNETWLRDQGPHTVSVEGLGAHDPSPAEIEAHEGHAVVGLSAVRNPGRTLTNLTVYSRGRDIGHIKTVATDGEGVPRRVLIAFNDGVSTAWVDAAAIDYDAGHRLAVTALDPGEIKAMAATRFH